MLAAIVWFAPACAHAPAQLTDRTPRFHEDAAADVVLHFYQWDTIHLIRPSSREHGFLPLLNREDVAGQLARAQGGHNLAVVVIGYRNTSGQQARLIREWKSLLAGQGFRRVVFLRADRSNQNQIDGLPILHDSAIAGGT